MSSIEIVGILNCFEFNIIHQQIPSCSVINKELTPEMSMTWKLENELNSGNRYKKIM